MICRNSLSLVRVAAVCPRVIDLLSVGFGVKEIVVHGRCGKDKYLIVGVDLGVDSVADLALIGETGGCRLLAHVIECRDDHDPREKEGSDERRPDRLRGGLEFSGRCVRGLAREEAGERIGMQQVVGPRTDSNHDNGRRSCAQDEEFTGVNAVVGPPVTEEDRDAESRDEPDRLGPHHCIELIGNVVRRREHAVGGVPDVHENGPEEVLLQGADDGKVSGDDRDRCEKATDDAVDRLGDCPRVTKSNGTDEKHQGTERSQPRLLEECC